MAITVGRISHLNFDPFYIDMERRGITLREVQPNEAAHILKSGEVDASPVPLVDSFSIEGPCVPVAGFCLSASTRAGSHLFYAKKPIEEFGGARIATFKEDSTTLELLQVLLQQKYGVTAGEIVPMSEEHDGFVVSGDDALRRRRGARGYAHRYDLGEQWHSMTDLPFVFSRWMMRHDMDAKDSLLLEDTLYVGLEDGVDSLFHLSEPKDYLLMLARDVVEYIIGYRYFVGLSEKKSIQLFQEYRSQLATSS